MGRRFGREWGPRKKQMMKRQTAKGHRLSLSSRSTAGRSAERLAAALFEKELRALGESRVDSSMSSSSFKKVGIVAQGADSHGWAAEETSTESEGKGAEALSRLEAAISRFSTSHR